ncbi:MAG: L-aspartate oxidase [Alphaproteobacteria bacterium]|nr:L-aspartate oxidase [Alphaproteobacteria bacterium]
MKPVILGAGLAGLSTALALAPRPVTLVSPCALGDGCSSDLAQGGLAAAVGEDDTCAAHARDTLLAGDGLSDESIVDQTVSDAPHIVDYLERLGVVFDHDAHGSLSLGREAAHSRRRIVRAKDTTGHIVTQALIRAVRATPSIDVWEQARAIRIVADEGRVQGVFLRKSSETIWRQTSALVLATGGAAALWQETTVPHENWGSGLALALRAGATLENLEFLQFHPTAIDVGLDPMPLASEALRGEGVPLVDETGQPFTDSLQRRDIVARAIWNHIQEGHRVYLDAREVLGASFASHFPTIDASCRAAGIDPVTSPIPVRPAAHYHMGGVMTDEHGRTSVEGLWACGEVACTGLHGANRLASNSLLEAASFGQKVANDILGHDVISAPPPSWDEPFKPDDTAQDSLIRKAMSRYVGVVRDHDGLQQAMDFLSPLAQQSDKALVGLMIAACAQARRESRGAHFRSDFPKTAPKGCPSHFALSDLEALL